MVNQKNKQTFRQPRVGEVSNLAGAECTINSKVYHSLGPQTGNVANSVLLFVVRHPFIVSRSYLTPDRLFVGGETPKQNTPIPDPPTKSLSIFSLTAFTKYVMIVNVYYDVHL